VYETHHVERQRLGTSALEEIRGPLFAQWIGSGKGVLDVGCRDGTLSKWFRKGNVVHGIDIDESALRVRKQSIGPMEILADINQSLPFRSESFDVVVVGEVMEHTFFPC
jgi:2-polyprenyl-3-methyl-5-hydroxy-6-metoxy-1,4-benzoquinol methylase